MEQFALSYIVVSAARRVYMFFYGWYVRGAIRFTHGTVNFLESLDQTFAIKTTWQHFGEPLYQDRSIVGYVMGFFFRSGRILMGGFMYILIIIGAALLFAVWSALPLYLIYKIIF